jgi:glycine oxidase
VQLSDGSRLGADYVLLAAGAGTPHIGGLEQAGLPEIRPVKGHILRLGPAAGVAGRGPAAGPVGVAGRGPAVGAAPAPPLLNRTVRALVHGRAIYLVPRPDGSLVVGATMEERGEDLGVRVGAVHELLSDARAIVPGIDELELREAQTGLRPATPDNTPALGWTNLPGVAVASGHFRNGMLLAPLTATAIVDLLAGRGPAIGAPS